jgi:predicted membrane-bound mannosyltransferase
MDARGHEDSPGSGKARRTWIVSAALIAAVLFWAATSNEVYDITSPPALTFHVLLRKAYSIAAFAVVGFTADKALGASTRGPLRAAVLVAVYSGAIEIVQAMRDSHEGLAWNAVDVVCGAVGGWLGVVLGRITRESFRRGAGSGPVRRP